MSNKKDKVKTEQELVNTLRGDCKANQVNSPEHFKLVNKETATSIPLNEDGGNIEMLNDSESKEAFGKKWKTSSEVEVARYRLSRCNFQLFGLATKRLAILKQMEIDKDLIKEANKEAKKNKK